MQTYKAPLKEARFVLEALQYPETVGALEKYEAFDLDTLFEILSPYTDFFVDEVFPLNPVGDREGLKYDPKEHTVTTPKGFTEAYKKFSELGLMGICQPEQYGGSGAPMVLGIFLSEFLSATNKSFSMCPGLTNGLISALLQHGSDELKNAYLPKLVSGEWTGTMCLTEPQSGTDLGLVNTKATPEGDHYILSGTKIWITFGEHDMADNIIHLVLARLPDAPPGIKGISLFLVPKVNLDGTRNPIYCGGLEHKMGIHASPTCVMNLEDCKGWLVGAPHKGMRAMFTMMNHARISVGLEGVALGEVAYQTALAFAKDRRQSRSLNPERREMDAPADNILVHPDVRRMLLNIKATNEPMRALACYLSMQEDIAHYHKDEETRHFASDIVAILTPVVKSFMTERGFLNINDAMQLLGGSGYTTDWCIEQYMRDVRIAMIYEGTNHIQALDLVGRKLPEGMGRMFLRFNELISQFIRENKENAELQEFINPLKTTSKKLGEITMGLSARVMEDREQVGALASNYLNLFAFTALSYMWCVLLKHAQTQEGKFAKAKFKTARYYFQYVLPEVDMLVQRINLDKSIMMDFDVDEF